MCPMCRHTRPLGALKGSMIKGVPKTEVADIKAKNATIAFSLQVLSSSSLFLVYFSSAFPSLAWFYSLSGAVYCKFRKDRFQKNGEIYYLYKILSDTQAEASRVLAYDWLEWNNQSEKALQPKPEIKAQDTRSQGSINHAWERRFSNGTNFWMVCL